MNQFFVSGGQIIGASASASVLPMNIQDWFPIELTWLDHEQYEKYRLSYFLLLLLEIMLKALSLLC